jgi:hypothetical protein
MVPNLGEWYLGVSNKHHDELKEKMVLKMAFQVNNEGVLGPESGSVLFSV